MATNLLINELVREHAPRRVVAKPEKRVWQLLFVALVISLIILVLTGRRSALNSDLVLHYYYGEIILLVALLASTIEAVLRSLIPGENISLALKRTLGLFLAWVGLLGVGIITGITPNMPLEGASCIAIIGIGSLVPAILLISEAKKGFVLNGNVTGVLIALSSALVGVLGVEAHCEWESANHHLIFHMLPLLIIAGCGIFMRKLLKQEQ